MEDGAGPRDGEVEFHMSVFWREGGREGGRQGGKSGWWKEGRRRF